MVKQEPIVVCVCGDAPNLPTGLARIARDLVSLLRVKEEELGIKIVQLGYDYDGSPWVWPVFPMINPKWWGRGSLERLYSWLGQPREWVVLTVWDAGRCFGLLQDLITDEILMPRTRLWGYFPVDSNNPEGKIGGPGGEILKVYDRVLGYGRYGAVVLAATRGDEKPGEWLPHGVQTSVFTPIPGWAVDDKIPDPSQDWLRELAATAEASVLLGGVATNQPRKDLGLFFATAAKLRERWPELRLWLHSDQEVTEAWAIPELAGLYGWNNSRFTLTTHEMPDEDLACAYSFCHATLAPGGGEGFGYPIAESLACGTPVIHGDYGGGAELIPVAGWKVQPIAFRVSESVAHLRPVYSPEEWAGAARQAIEWSLREPEVVREFCRGAVAYLDWGQLGPRWWGWLTRGVKQLREEGGEGE